MQKNKVHLIGSHHYDQFAAYRTANAIRSLMPTVVTVETYPEYIESEMSDARQLIEATLDRLHEEHGVDIDYAEDIMQAIVQARAVGIEPIFTDSQELCDAFKKGKNSGNETHLVMNLISALTKEAIAKGWDVKRHIDQAILELAQRASFEQLEMQHSKEEERVIAAREEHQTNVIFSNLPTQGKLVHFGGMYHTMKLPGVNNLRARLEKILGSDRIQSHLLSDFN